MKNNNSTTFIVVSSIFVLCVFAFVVAYNILPNNKESNSYYVKVGDDMSAKIETVEIHDGKLYITTSGDPIEYCVKSTKSKPDSKNLCWNKIENNIASISIYRYKKYYIWIKDDKGNISNYLTVNSNEKDKN
ncbi:hypothetical protein EGP95_06290 [bacterium]|jgi:hypothetical protein|nr:hypothetical protein [bacterium]